MSTAAARREQRLHRFFEITLLLKALFAAGEIVAAIGVYVVPLDTVADFVGAITSAELAKHPHDFDRRSSRRLGAEPVDRRRSISSRSIC